MDRSSSEVVRSNIRKIEYQCLSCGQTIVKEQSDKYYKAILPICPLCGNSNWKILELK